MMNPITLLFIVSISKYNYLVMISTTYKISFLNRVLKS